MSLNKCTGAYRVHLSYSHFLTEIIFMVVSSSRHLVTVISLLRVGLHTVDETNAPFEKYTM